MAERRGFALLTVLWTLVGASAIALAANLRATESVREAVNRTSEARAYWRAEGCAARMLDGMARRLSVTQPTDDPQLAWRNLDRMVPAIADSDAVGTCEATLSSNGACLDLNRASPSELLALLLAADIVEPRADSLVAAALDWRDEDDRPRPGGAERDWYASRRRPLPRNAPYANAAEILRVRGFDALPGDEQSTIAGAVGVDCDPVDLWHAPSAVLRTLPGFDREVADAVVSVRARSDGAWELSRLATMLPSPAHDSIAANFDRIVTRATTQPVHWLVTVVGRSGSPAIAVHLELLLAESGSRLATVRRRYWTE